MQLNRPPDAILELPFGEFELPAQGEVPTFTVWMKLPFREDRFIQAIEMRPSVRNAVHHSSMSLGPLPSGRRLGAPRCSRVVRCWTGSPYFQTAGQ